MLKNRVVYLTAIFIFLAVFLIGCERPATQTNWSPINSAGTAENVTPLPAGLPTSTETKQVATTAAQPITALDFTNLPKILPHSIKGYDLYSWQTGEVWNFTLITGTNRTKSFDEIITPENSISTDGFVKISLSGLDDLKELLKRLPSGESILWGGMDLGGQVPEGTVYLTFPPQDMLNELTAYCAEYGLTLTSLKQ